MFIYMHHRVSKLDSRRGLSYSDVLDLMNVLGWELFNEFEILSRRRISHSMIC